MTHATAWMNLEDNMLSEISRSQRGRYYMIHLYEAATVVRFIETESRMLVARGWGNQASEREMESL